MGRFFFVTILVVWVIGRVSGHVDTNSPSRIHHIDRLISSHSLDSILQQSYSWNYDTVLENEAYKSYYSYELREPIMVIYKLYPGHYGVKGLSKRPKFDNDIKALNGKIARSQDYSRSGYDEGHMANWADFAWSPSFDSLTCKFYNCSPQTHALNAGPYEVWEKLIREESRTDSLLVVCWNIYSEYPQRIGADSIAVPIACAKVVQSLAPPYRTHHILYFSNSKLAYWDSVATQIAPEQD